MIHQKKKKIKALFKCGCCDKILFEGNVAYADSTLIKAEKIGNGDVFKNITVLFLTDEGEVLLKCKGCGQLTKVPFLVNKKRRNELLDL